MSGFNDCSLDAANYFHSKWIYLYFGECVVSLRQYFAFIVGLLSIVFWIFAQWPQVVTSCRTGTAHKSVSFWFLLFWLFSDSTNFLGAILAHQLFTQILTAAYYVFMDLVCLLQVVLHYTKERGFRCGTKRSWGYRRIYVISLVIFLPALATFLFPLRNDDSDIQWKSRRLLESVDLTNAPPLIDIHDSHFMTGYILGCISSLSNIFGLPLQIIKNFRRGSVEGLSTLMFIFVTFGDSTYLASILLYSTDKAFLIEKLPWTSLSALSIVFDLVILFQILVYKTMSYMKSKKKRDLLLQQSSTVPG